MQQLVKQTALQQQALPRTAARPGQRCLVPLHVLTRQPGARAQCYNERHFPPQAKVVAAEFSSPKAADPFVEATMRLEELLTDVRRGDNANMLDEVESYDTPAKMLTLTNGGAALGVFSILLCWLCGEDPLGGMTLSESSLEAAGWGAAFAAPLLLCSATARLGSVRRSFPVMEELHESQRELLAPVLQGMNAPQVGIVLSFLVLPAGMLLLPGIKGTLDALVGLLFSILAQPFGDQLHLVHDGGSMHPPALGILVPAMASAYLAGVVVASVLHPHSRQVSAIRGALRSAERYFKLTLSMKAPGTGASTSKSAAEAFKTVSLLWLISKRRVAQLATILTVLNCYYYSLIWSCTGDLTAAAVAALLHNAVEVGFVSWEERKRAEEAQLRRAARDAQQL